MVAMSILVLRSEIAATLYAQASSRLDTSRLLFIDDESELPVVDRLGLALDAEDFIRICSGLGLGMSGAHGTSHFGRAD